MKNGYLIILLFVVKLSAQVGIGTTNPEGALDITATNDGLLIPRVALSATNVATVVTPTISELVYNTATAGVAPNNVTPGFYYWDGSVWVRIRGGNGNDWSLNGNAGTTAGTNFIGTTDAVDLRLRTNNANRWNISNANNGQLQSYNLGTATTPTYSWQGDPNTGIFSSGADNLNITTNGTERVRVAANGNVGIGTTNPSKELHVGGTTSTIRVDGLNATNNANNLGGGLTTPVHVNSSGDLVIPTSPSSTAMLFSSDDILSTVINVATTGNGDYVQAQLFQQSFTLTKPALVIVNYSMGYNCRTTTGGIIIDGKAKITQNWFRFGDGTIPTSSSLATSGQSYSNAATNTATGFMYNSGTGMMMLSAGTHSIHFYGGVFAGGVAGAPNFRSQFGGSNSASLYVYAIY